ncbi:hypothetical protein LWI29_031000 [Acer saccharum]|uniref:Pectinesterase inhibitor domain-containing protein n=1 Tax=Acer saccharum TaxID=4024 RepID=A0AA39VZC1_ACESA|nr:hypothetical protein LWI29_031000 [Acer saccharum]
MAVFKHCMSLSLAFLAVAATVLLLAGNAAATSVDLCKKIHSNSTQELCKSVIKGTTDPRKATELAIKALIVEIGHVKEANVCNEEMDEAIDNLNGALKFLKSNDKGSLNDYLAEVVADFGDCEEEFEESGKTSPLAKTTETAKKMASNCLALASQIH